MGDNINAPLYIFCVDVGGTRTKYGLFDTRRGVLSARIIWPTDTLGPSEFIATVTHALDEVCTLAHLPRGLVSAGAVGVPGFVDGDLISMICESLGFMQNPNFCSTLRAALPFPVQFDNDARIISMGEAYFGGHGQPRRLLSLTLGTGIGFSMVVEGRLQEKSSVNHLAGHIPIRPGARKCFCGFSGCLESLVSASALVECFQRGRNEILSSTDITEVDSRAILEAAESGSPAALQAVHQILNDLLLGLNGYIYLFAPEVIVLGGGMAQGLHPWLGNLQKGLFAHPYDGYSVDIHLSELKEDAGLFGAASLWAPGYYLSYKDYYK